MSNSVVVGIDLGSSYTKVAIRDGWNADAELVRQMQGSTQEMDFCIPSTTARVRRQGRDTWVIGVDADALKPGPEVELFVDWKADLFAATGDGAITGAKRDQAREVATQFFVQLKQALRPRLREFEAEDAPVRICVPKLDDVDVATLLVKVISDAGLQGAASRITVFEPESNAIGILTRGVNRMVTQPYQDFSEWVRQEAHLPSMLDSKLNGLMRRAVLEDRADSIGVLVVDLGAFTTDFGFVELDARYTDANWKRPYVTQDSQRVGVRELDRRFRRTLGEVRPEALAALKPLSNADWERYKRLLYDGKTVMVPGPVGGVNVRVGGETRDQRAVEEATTRYASYVWDKADAFINSLGGRKVQKVCLTGGGASIMKVREYIKKNLLDRFDLVERDLLDPDEPTEALGVDSPAAERNARRKRNDELVRGASAIGAVSVYFE